MFDKCHLCTSLWVLGRVHPSPKGLGLRGPMATFNPHPSIESRMAEDLQTDETDQRAETATYVWAGAAALVSALAAVWFFLSTGEPVILLSGLLVVPYLIMLPWTVVDARRKGLPVFPWFLVVLLLHVLGFMVYLVVREWDALRAR